jgi:hypothetical protein
VEEEEEEEEDHHHQVLMDLLPNSLGCLLVVCPHSRKPVPDLGVCLSPAFGDNADGISGK